ncbi:MAG: hypothetical protein KAJ97_04670 [Acidobacteria bacterium]|nr:hypothetical protein [Acidobacteriota bacterium]
MTTRKILMTLAVLVILAVAAGRFLYHEGPGSKTAPAELIGTWTTDHSGYSDRYVELRENTITFGTGGTSFVHYTILGVEKNPSVELDVYTVHFRDVGGTKFKKDIVLQPSDETFYFRNQADVIWTLFER